MYCSILCAGQSRSVPLQMGSVCGVWGNVLAGCFLAVSTSDSGIHSHLGFLRRFFPQDRGPQPGHSFFSVLPGTFRFWLSPKTPESICLPVHRWSLKVSSVHRFSSELRFPHSGLSNKCSRFHILSGVSRPLYLAAQCCGDIFPSKSSWRGNLIHRTWTMSMVIGF